MGFYPAYRYHELRCPYGVIVNSDAEAAALGSGWVTSPDKFVRPRKPQAPAPVIEVAPEPVKVAAKAPKEVAPPKAEPSKEEPSKESVSKSMDEIELPRKRSSRKES